MIQYSTRLKSKLFNLINQNQRAFNQKDDDWVNDSIINFLNSIWDLRSLPSEDQRFDNAYDDAYKHLVSNDDWTYEYTFIDRFKLLENDDHFTLFLETLVHPNYREGKEDIEFYVTLINSELEDHALYLSDYFEDLPIYRIHEKVIDKRTDILENTIPFYVSDSIIEKNNSFTLISNNWDDYGSRTTFQLFYYSNNTGTISLDTVKITDGKSDDTVKVLPKQFVTLSNNFCSIGQSEDYYKKIKFKPIARYSY